MSRKDAEKHYRNLKQVITSFEDHLNKIPHWRYDPNKECICEVWEDFVNEKISDTLFSPHKSLSFSQDEFVSAIEMDKQKDFEHKKHIHGISYPLKDDIWNYLRNTLKGGTQWKCGS